MNGETRTYHHSNLRAALVETGLQRAREGGRQALGLREIAREIGVSPNAAYRHFPNRDALILVIAVEAQAHLALSMQERSVRDDSLSDPADRAIDRLRGVGLGYIDFALTEPGWFELAVLTFDAPAEETLPVTTDDRIPPPYQLLLDALDQLEQVGILNSQQRIGAEWTCWSAVHGFAELATVGPLREQPRTEIDQLAASVVESTINGILRCCCCPAGRGRSGTLEMP